jgi:hypothetical protein
LRRGCAAGGTCGSAIIAAVDAEISADAEVVDATGSRRPALLPVRLRLDYLRQTLERLEG